MFDKKKINDSKQEDKPFVNDVVELSDDDLEMVAGGKNRELALIKESLDGKDDKNGGLI